MALEREIETYNRLLPELLADEGKYVVIQGETVVGKYASLDDAVREGYSRFLTEPFLVRRIQAEQPIVSFSRGIRPCLSSSGSGVEREPSSKP